ncbi:MAG: helix-turn-helix transcriptional regulator [Bacilli bacterium]|nr:helix-turn-helix transcriptional regulator [Bacilli bacterium]
MSQEKLAEMSNMSTNYIGDIERGNRKVTIDTIEKIANGLKIDPALLLTKRNK